MYYVYVYLDPRKPGKYKYGKYEFNYEPFYIGKGKINRYKSYKNRNNYFINIINKLKKLKLKPIIIKLYENLNENESIKLEIKLIKIIGRKDINQGSLINMTDGGDGVSGLIFSEESKQKLSILNSGRNNCMFGVHRFGKDNPMFGRKHSKKTKEKISKSNSGKNAPNYGKNFSQNHKYKIGDAQIGIKNHMARLTEEDITKIWIYLDEGILTQKEIAKKFDVSQVLISRIKLKKTWKHIRRNKNVFTRCNG